MNARNRARHATPHNRSSNSVLAQQNGKGSLGRRNSLGSSPHSGRRSSVLTRSLPLSIARGGEPWKGAHRLADCFRRNMSGEGLRVTQNPLRGGLSLASTRHVLSPREVVATPNPGALTCAPPSLPHPLLSYSFLCVWRVCVVCVRACVRVW